MLHISTPWGTRDDHRHAICATFADKCVHQYCMHSTQPLPIVYAANVLHIDTHVHLQDIRRRVTAAQTKQAKRRWLLAMHKQV
jgi:hypothetical protein